jgi:hypothetical protein
LLYQPSFLLIPFCHNPVTFFCGIFNIQEYNQWNISLFSHNIIKNKTIEN